MSALVRAAIDGASEAAADDSDAAWRCGVAAALVAGFPPPSGGPRTRTC